MNAFKTPIRIYIEDTDAGGIVYYVNYLKFMERGRSEFLRSLGYNKPALAFESQQFVVTQANVDYHAPCFLDDEIDVQTTVVQLKRASMVFHQQLFNNGELSCSGRIKVANVNADTKKPVALPDAMYRQLQGLLN